MTDEQGRADRTFSVGDALEGERLDRAVALVTGWSRGAVSALVEAGDVLVEGRAAARSRRLRLGERIEIRGEPPREQPPAADPTVPFEVRYEDEAIAVIAKPAGIVVHPGAGGERATLAHGLLARFPEIEAVGPDAMRPGIVHRLDRGTSGLLVVALRQDAHEQLVEMLRNGEVDREYVALVWGKLGLDHGAIEAPVGRSARTPARMAVTPSGRDARTRYEVSERFDDPECSLVEVGLDTGRTHQIRVHFSSIGHPVVGDETYGGARTGLDVSRPFLHAARLAFTHPLSGETVACEEPLPEDLASVLQGLRARAHHHPFP